MIFLHNSMQINICIYTLAGCNTLFQDVSKRNEIYNIYIYIYFFKFTSNFQKIRKLQFIRVEVSLHLLRYKTFFIMKCLQTNCIVQSLRQLNIRRNIRRVLRYVKHEFSESRHTRMEKIHLHIEIFYVIKLKPLISKIQNIRRRAPFQTFLLRHCIKCFCYT